MGCKISMIEKKQVKKDRVNKTSKKIIYQTNLNDNQQNQNVDSKSTSEKKQQDTDPQANKRSIIQQLMNQIKASQFRKVKNSRIRNSKLKQSGIKNYQYDQELGSFVLDYKGGVSEPTPVNTFNYATNLIHYNNNTIQSQFDSY